MKLTTLLRLLERSNIPNKEELKEQLLTAYEKYKTGEASRTDVERVITVILKRLNVDASTPVRRLRRIRDKPAPSDEVKFTYTRLYGNQSPHSTTSGESAPASM